MFKKSIIILLVFIVSIITTSCSNKFDRLETVNLILDWTPNTNHTGIYIADELGFFKENGIKVNIIQPPEDSSIILLGSGKAQFCISFQDSFAQALSSNTPVPATAVAAILNHNTSGILSKKSCNIQSPKDLEGKTYSTWNLPIETAMLKHIVAKSGGNFDLIHTVPNSSSDAASAFSSGIDAINVYYGWDAIAAEAKGIDTNFLRFTDIEKNFDFYAPIIIANNKYLETNPDTVKRFLAALDAGYTYSIENPKAAADILIKKNPELNKNIVYKSQEWLSPQYKDQNEPWGKIDETRWTNFFRWLYEEKLISKDLNSSGFSNEYLKYSTD